MIQFVNAKINLGLYVTRRRDDGYHDLLTAFYPIGIHNGTPENPEPFCDLLEVVHSPTPQLIFSGNPIDCAPEKNLVTKARDAFFSRLLEKGIEVSGDFAIRLEKHLPDGAGLGGGSADASFTLRLLNEASGNPLTTDELMETAAGLGADCPFFIKNTPVVARGTGDEFTPLPEILRGYWALVVKPPVSVSTREAFAGITPHAATVDLENLLRQPPAEWRDRLHNDFEDTLFPLHPLLRQIKTGIYGRGALYASMTGSGSALYGIFDSIEAIQGARCGWPERCFVSVCKL